MCKKIFEFWRKEPASTIDLWWGLWS